MPTPHIEANNEDIAKIVIMPGDPLRAKMIAETYLDNPKLINEVRNILGYTGTYKGKEVTIMASGMGMPSMGIYSYELFKFYDVEQIIRVGSCGSYTKDLNLRDIILVESAYSETTYDDVMTGTNNKILHASTELNKKIKEVAFNNNIFIYEGRIHCSDVFYSEISNIDKPFYEYNCLGVEMESFALFQNANIFNKKASAILTVSDNLITKEETTSEERQNSFKQMIFLALESIL